MGFGGLSEKPIPITTLPLKGREQYFMTSSIRHTRPYAIREYATPSDVGVY